MEIFKGIIDISLNDAGLTTVKLNMYIAAGIAAILFWVGNYLVDHIAFLKERCIPAPLVGGLFFAITNTILNTQGIATLAFDDTLQSFFMLVFFCTVGYTVSLPLLKSGGKSILIMLLLGLVMTLLQNLMGGGIMAAFGEDPRLGVAAGSVALIGGPGTAAAFGKTMDLAISEGGFGMEGVGTLVGVTAAVFGLVSGSIIGGPVAVRRINQYHLESTDKSNGEEETEEFTSNGGHFTQAAMLLAVAIGIGQLLSAILKAATGLTFPGYIGAMLVAAVIRNVVDARSGGKRFQSEEIDAIGGLSLNLFLAMAMMGLKLWQIAALATPLIVTLAAQIVLMILFSYFVVFKVMGSNYNAAVQTAGFVGFAMGATSNAMANMQAITKQHGPAREAYFVIPMVGGLFIDFFNAGIITLFLGYWTPGM